MSGFSCWLDSRSTWQDNCLGTSGKVDADAEHVGVFEGLVFRAAVAVGTDIGDVSILEERLGVAVVSPLSDEAGVVGHVDFDFAQHFLLSLLAEDADFVWAVASDGSGKEIYLIIIACGQGDGVAEGEAVEAVLLAENEADVARSDDAISRE